MSLAISGRTPPVERAAPSCLPVIPAGLLCVSSNPCTMRILVLLLTTFLLLHQGPPVSSDLDTGRICGYGTSRCRTRCKSDEFRIGRCLNTYACCLKKWSVNKLNPMKDRNPVVPGS
nr:beta-defensin 104 [Camelus bactrianus]